MPPSTPARVSAAVMTSACRLGLGLVKPTVRPLWLTALPRTTARTWSLSRRASASRLSTTTPTPSPGTMPLPPIPKAGHSGRFESIFTAPSSA